MRYQIKKIVIGILLLSICTSAIACSSQNESSRDAVSRKTDVRIAYFPNITHTQALVMKNQKTLEKKWGDRCKVTWTSFNAGPAEMEAIFAGEIDLGYIGPVPALSANVKSNGDVKIISNTTNAGAVLLKRKDSGIDSLSDLAGKKIAVPQMGNTQHLCLLNILSDQGLKTVDAGGDVTINASSNADILNLIDNGSVDAALVPEPWGTTIENNGNAEILLEYNEVFLEGNYPTAVVVASRDFIEKNPDLVKDFLEAHEEATLYINENIDEARSIVNTEIKAATGKAIDEDVLKNAFTRMTVDTALNKEAIMKFAEISKKEGFISEVPEESDVFTTEFN
ncbi:MAG: aliphatic sulfonate ABC transporter substrate-binding protein [Muribaculaceae bacterium]|nr:aliphatic sulfonate ABC transporter substrate-binding protein [Roseburia sp.]MCM1429862.1 aliphatic sulfonate ABC transporter substrate-binding protein [Muribaculaceae bacterium]MCM1492913.1 aliphatic sulfonate ABC transporter substrate-binding protein [Muribaculaceae bacterium]